MNRGFTIALGEMRLTHYKLGNKAALLDQVSLKDISNKGLMPARFAPVQMAVPKGCVVLDEFFRHATSNGLATIENKTVTIPNAKAFMDAIELPPITGRVAVRSAFTGEDQADFSMAGRFESVLNVPIESYGLSPSQVRDPQPLADAIARVWTSGLQQDVAGRMDVLVMEMVNAKYAGVAFTELDYEDDLVNYTAGLAADMVSGRAPAQTIELPKLYGLENPSVPSNLPFVHRLQVLLRSVRLAMGKGNWDVEWADDGEKIWVLQIRPITAATVRNEVFSSANLKEVLPEVPSRFMATLIESCSDDIFSYYREFDGSLPQHRRYIEVFHGRPMINVSLMADVMRHWGSPTALVTSSLGGAPVTATPMNPRRWMKNRGVHLALKRDQVRAIRAASEVGKELLAITENPGNTISEVVDTAKLVYAKYMRSVMPLISLISGSKSASGSSGSLGTQMYQELTPLRTMVQTNPDLAVALRNGEVPRDVEFRRKWEAWLNKHGHRGAYETDLARPRFRENAADILRSLTVAPPAGTAATMVLPSPARALAGRSPAAAAVKAREELRFDAMRAFERLRYRLLELATPKGVTADMFFSLSIDEANQLDSGWRPTSEFMEQRKREQEELAQMEVPHVIRRNDAIGSSSTAFQGTGLSRGEAVGKAWVLREPSLALPEGYAPGETILVARSVDAGWAPTFGLVAGVVVETGGALSHGSIVLRELGIPAVTDIREATRKIQSGQTVRVAASQGRVDVLG